MWQIGYFFFALFLNSFGPVIAIYATYKSKSLYKEVSEVTNEKNGMKIQNKSATPGPEKNRRSTLSE
jgi:hypothetical protein